MALGTVLSVAGTLFSALQSPKLEEALSIFDYKSQLDDLRGTVGNIKAVLRGAEDEQELSEQDQELIEKLKDAVFGADDLFDEFVTLAELKQLRNADGRLSEKVIGFFSASNNPFSLAHRMSHGVKDIKKKLDAIAYGKQFSFKINPEPMRKGRPETDSFVKENEFIGRERDLEEIVGHLLGSNDQNDVSVLSIVGIGGLGKTSLAQHVYNHPRVTSAFPSRMWTCVSDENQEELDVKSILVKILASITGSNPDQGPTLDQVQTRLRQNLTRKKYLLVLDDVWTESRDQWCQLVRYLTGHKTGSWIVVTTRSHRTAEITGGLTYPLSGLLKENSWRLFERAAFGTDQPNIPDELATIGQEIVDRCSGVPLAIRVAGSLLYGQHKSMWLFVQKIGLANIREVENGIMPILKLSFHHLETPLKNCFRYCAIFPKDYAMEKETLISLWAAQGYIVPLNKQQSIEDVGEQYFSILTRRCFLQVIDIDEFGGFESCKIHDLMHDMAQIVAGKEVCALDSNSGNVEINVRHLLISNDNNSELEKYFPLGESHIRSLLFFGCKTDFSLEALVAKFTRLRMLIMRGKNIKRLPDSIGKLLHLRYMDLSWNGEMEALPNSITKLYNLQILMLEHCIKLKELPKELSRLVNLRLLDIRLCKEITYMPRGMGKLTCLHTLKGSYIVGVNGSCTSWEQWFDGLRELKTLTNLKGGLQICMWWPTNAKNDVKEDMKEESYLSSMENLNDITLSFKNNEEGGRTDDEGIAMKLMQNLRPQSNLKSLEVLSYHGVKMPDWVTRLSNLLHLVLSCCKELRYLPSLENLRQLKCLTLCELRNLEYIEVERVSFFPSLEELELEDLPKFKGWRRGAGVEAGTEESSNSSSNQTHLLPCCLRQLKQLIINKCPEFTCIMVCPILETLRLEGCNGRWQIVWGTKAYEILSEAATIQNNPENSGCKSVPPNLRKMNYLSNEEDARLNWKPMESFDSLRTLHIEGDDELVELPSWMQYLSALQYLEIEDCRNLKAMPNWMPKLTSLTDLTIHKCSESLNERCQEEPPGEDWPYIEHIPFIFL